MLKFKRVTEFHYTFDGVDLIKARNASGLTQEELAEKCGWSRQWQWELEKLGTHTISQEAKIALEKAFGM